MRKENSDLKQRLIKIAAEQLRQKELTEIQQRISITKEAVREAKLVNRGGGIPWHFILAWLLWDW